ncbi:MAG: hypothetical protein AAF849_21160 [Bacteroidota bacterium]
MAEQGKSKKEGNIYDRIFKENAEGLFLPLVEQELGLKIKSIQAIPNKFARTLERETDFLYQIITEEEEKGILHLEVQTKDDHEIIYRMMEYHALIYRKYKLPIQHVVIYLGQKKSRMRSKLEGKEVFSGFELLSVHELNTTQLLSSQIPEVILLALLSNYEEERTEAVLRHLVKELRAAATSESDFKKYMNQLIILSRLRNLQETTIQTISDMILEYDVEQDFLYKKGIEKGIKEERERLAQEMALLEEAKAVLAEERLRAKKEKAIAEEERERIAQEKAIAEEERERIAQEKAIAEEERERIAQEKAIAEEERERIAQEKAIAEREKEQITEEKFLVEQEKERITQEKAIAEEEREQIAREKEQITEEKFLVEQEKERITQEKVEMIKSLLRLNIMNDEQIAEISNKSIEYIQSVRAEL